MLAGLNHYYRKSLRWAFISIRSHQSDTGYTVYPVYRILRGGNAEKWTFDWEVAPLKYGCEVVEWSVDFNKKYSKFNFGH